MMSSPEQLPGLGDPTMIQTVVMMKMIQAMTIQVMVVVLLLLLVREARSQRQREEGRKGVVLRRQRQHMQQRKQRLQQLSKQKRRRLLLGEVKKMALQVVAVVAVCLNSRLWTSRR